LPAGAQEECRHPGTIDSRSKNGDILLFLKKQNVPILNLFTNL